MYRFYVPFLFITILSSELMALGSYAGEMNLSGKVTDASGKPLHRVAISLKQEGLVDTTDTQGNFSLVKNATVGISQGTTTPLSFSATLHNNLLNLSLANPSKVVITVHSLVGKLVSSRQNLFASGSHTIVIPPAKSGVYIYSIKAGNQVIQFKAFTTGDNWQRDHLSPSPSDVSYLAKEATLFEDTLKAVKTGFDNFSLPISNPIQSGIAIKLNTTSDPGEDPGTVVNGCPVKMEGWAQLAGTTGGGNAIPQKVTSVAELRTLSKDTVPRVLQLEGTYDLGSEYLRVGSNKTFIGIGKNTVVKAMVAGFSLRRSHNVILRNFTVIGGGDVGTEGGDAVTATEAERLWFDHLTITDGPDGILDLTQGTTNVTVSWCKIYYNNTSQPHRYAMQFSSGSYVTTAITDRGKLDITMHHNWFGALVDQRMPRHLWGRGHIYNSYYNSPKNTYCIGGGSWASLLIENNYFKDVNDPYRFQDDCPTYIAAEGNFHDNSAGKKETGLFNGIFPACLTGGAEAVIPGPWRPVYKYKLDEAKLVPELVQRCAGPL